MSKAFHDSPFREVGETKDNFLGPVSSLWRWVLRDHLVSIETIIVTIITKLIIISINHLINQIDNQDHQPQPILIAMLRSSPDTIIRKNFLILLQYSKTKKDKACNFGEK